MPTWYVRGSGNGGATDDNGGTSAAIIQQGTQGSSDGTTTFTATDANFVTANIGHAIQMVGAGFREWRLIVSITSSSKVVVSGAGLTTNATLSWRLGGALLTLQKILGNVTPTSIFAAGDTLWIGAASYKFVAFAANAAVLGTVSVDTKILGDPSGVNTGDPGEVMLVQATLDKTTNTAGATSPSINAGTAGGAGFLLVWPFTFGVTNRLAIEDLTFVPAGPGATAVATLYFSSAKGLNIRHCVFHAHTSVSGVSAAHIVCNDAEPLTGFDNIIEENIFLWAGGTTAAPATATTSSSPGGVRAVIFWFSAFTGTAATVGHIRNNLFMALDGAQLATPPVAVFTGHNGGSTTTFTGFTRTYANTFVGFGNCLTCWSGTKNTSGNREIFANNLIYATIAQSAVGSYVLNSVGVALGIECWGNVLIGTGSPKTLWAGLTTVYFDTGNSYMHAGFFDVGQSFIRRGTGRPFLTPNANGLSLGQAGGPPLSWLTSTTYKDFMGQFRRNASGGDLTSHPGYMEPFCAGIKEVTVVNSAGSSLELIGFASQSFQFPVDAITTTVSMYVQYDSNYGGTDLPGLQVRDGAECGVADQDVWMTAAANTWQQVNVTITPTSKGIITVRCIARSNAIAGKTYFDD